MLSVADFQERVRERPFVPFRIVTSCGESFDVRHPELLVIGTHWVMAGTGSRRDPTVWDQSVRVPRLHAAAIEDLPAATGRSRPPTPRPRGCARRRACLLRESSIAIALATRQALEARSTKEATDHCRTPFTGARP
jgi:hypothetical protein